MKPIYIFLSVFFSASLLHGQSMVKRKINDYITKYEVNENSLNKVYRINNTKSITSISIKYEGELTDSYLQTSDQVYPIYKDEHQEGAFNQSSLVVFEKPVSQFEFIVKDKKLKRVIQFTAIHAPAYELKHSNRQEEADCELPDLIPQSEWRSGLPAPSNSRSFSKTNNVIVHHSATFNSLTNYTSVVRNIYLFHTQDRGWSDVGYNYLIAPNGIIYAGRDPIQGEQDLVIGAHFCGRNSGTMGICLLGNLSLVEPSSDALASLSNLIAWKIQKDDLDPEGITNHPLNATLPVIAGHRDGCATQCPGNFTYPRLQEVRDEVSRIIEECNAPPHVEKERVYAVGPNPSTSGTLNILLPDNVIPSDVKFMDINGRNFTLPVTYYNVSSMQVDITEVPKGIYLMKINTQDFKNTEKLIKQ